MSKRDTIEITCPKCGSVESFSVWRTVNAEMNPELTLQIHKKEINVFTCPKCGARAHVDGELLFHDMGRKYMVWHIPTDDLAGEIAQRNKLLTSEIELGDVYKDYTLRIVPKRFDQVEKMHIFDSGFDDRVIEVLKLLIASQIGPQLKGETIDEIRFGMWDGEHKGLLFFGFVGEKQLPLRADPEMYKQAESMVSKYFETAVEWRCVDMNYADALIDKAMADAE
jgi:hypothetical protein